MSFLGEHECKMDAKGRVRIPGALKQQMNPAAKGKFVVNRGFEQCLVLYPADVWEKVMVRLNKLNTYRKKERQFVRYFLRGATELMLDGSDRINLPKQLAEFAGIEKELILAPSTNSIEVWNKVRYEDELNIDSDQFADLAETVLGNLEDDEASDDELS